MRSDGIENCLYMGGFKSAVNLDFLKNHHIGLIICAAKDLAQTFGPKYLRQLEKRSQELPQIKGGLILESVPLWLHPSKNVPNPLYSELLFFRE